MGAAELIRVCRSGVTLSPGSAISVGRIARCAGCCRGFYALDGAPISY